MDLYESRTDQSFWSQWKKAELKSPGFRGWILFSGLKLCCQYYRNILSLDLFVPGGFLYWYLEDSDYRTFDIDEVAALELLRHV